MVLIGGLSSGVLTGWTALLDVLLHPLGYTQVLILFKKNIKS